MHINDIRREYLAFFKERGHVVIPSASLVPEQDPTTLFTGSGMQPLLPYLLGQAHPEGSRVVDSQKCFRSGDIEEIGDNRHTTFFEMLGNWSFGDYFKKEQLSWIFAFLTDVVGLDPQKLYVTVFAGDAAYDLPEDTESALIWKDLFAQKGIETSAAHIGSEKDGYDRGIKENEHIFYYNAEKNWWSRSGVPGNMPIGEPGGGDSEIFYDFGVLHDETFGAHCHPNCDCGRFVEICNSVFMEYRKESDTTFSTLPQKNVDFGGGLERIAMAAQDTEDVFKVAYQPILQELEKLSHKAYAANTTETPWFRIVADHMKAAVFLIADGVLPSKSDRGYFVRRLIRRSMRYGDMLGVADMTPIIDQVIYFYESTFPHIATQKDIIRKVIIEEEQSFRTALKKGTALFEAWVQKGEQGEVPADLIFTLVTTHGFPVEILQELASEKGMAIDEEGYRTRMEEHQALSRQGAERKFKGGLADTSDKTTSLHTAHHLLLKALQLVLGEEVKQRGSNITQERLRIDFLHAQKMTDAQKEEVERIVNEVIQKDLPVIKSEMLREDAEALHAQHEFGAVYPERVTVYSVGPKEATPEDPHFEDSFSLEFCGGPHVTHTGTLGVFKIQKEESVAAGIRRIKAVLL